MNEDKNIEVANQAAFASVAYGNMGDGYCQVGLTKREYFAAMAMQGLCVQAIEGAHNQLNYMLIEIPEKAVAMADALINELNKTI